MLIEELLPRARASGFAHATALCGIQEQAEGRGTDGSRVAGYE